MLPFEPVELSGDDILFFQYTGGTTGLSKGAVLSHRNLVANTEQFKAFLPEATEPGREVLVLALPLYHIFGLMMMLAYASIGARASADPEPARHGRLHRRDQGREVLGAPRRQHPLPGADDAPAVQGGRPLELQDRHRRRRRR